MQAPEIELKFPVADASALHSLLPGFGFRLDTPRTFERNTLYDTPARDLRTRRQLLRIRQYGEIWTLTHKRLPDAAEASDTTRYKVRIETESRLEDGVALAEILTQLGYGPVFQYEKYRTEWSQLSGTGSDSAGHLVIDETPIGNYAELEGPPAWIDQTLAKLGISHSDCLTDSYGKLFLLWKQQTGSSAENLSYDEVAKTSLALR